MTAAPRVLMLGLDGATFDVLDPLMAAGEMPFLRQLVCGGARAELQSTYLPVTPPAWTSITTGRSPGHHGVFDFVRAVERRGRFYFTLTNSRDVRTETLWAILSRLGRRSISLNFPVSFPPRPFAGASVPGFVPWRHLRRYCHPPGLYDQLSQMPGFSSRALATDTDLERKSVQGLEPSEREAWLDLHLRRERQWHDVMAELMSTTEWDVAAVVFDGVDKLQHAFWRQLDPHESARDDDRTRALCLRYFRELDGYLAHLVDLAGPAAHVLVVSDHGFGPTHEIFYVNEWLQRQGLLCWTDDAQPDDTEDLAADRLKSYVTSVDWSRTLAYAMTPSSNGIFIRVADGPDAPGVPRDRYSAFRDRLARALLAIRDPESEAQVVTAVGKRERAYPGPYSASAPDLTLTLRDGGFVSVVRSPMWLRQRAEVQGTHRPEGVFVVSGPGVDPGAELPRLSILDVAPTVMHLAGEAIPADFEGRVPIEAFTHEFRQAQPVRAGPETVPAREFDAPTAPQNLPEDASNEVYARLEALGYLEA